MNWVGTFGDIMIVDKIVYGRDEEYSEDELKHLQKVLLMMLKDFHELCEENNITYFLCGGTTIGAIRHRGFIPWDDDIDLMMFRKDYNKLCNIISEFEEKYDFLSIESTKDYYRFYAKLSLKGTKTNEIWDRNTNFTLGIALDIFVLDFLPKNKFKQKIFIKKWEMYNKLAWFHEIATKDLYLSGKKEFIGRTIKNILEKLHLNQKFLVNRLNKLPVDNLDSSEIMELELGNFEWIFPLEIFYPPKKVNFENVEVFNPNDAHTYLQIKYGDYMKIPSDEEKINHSFDIDFGQY